MEPASCRVCGRAFPNRYQMLRHYREKHASRFEYTCLQCRRTYLNRADLTTHYDTRHPQYKDEAEAIPGKKTAASGAVDSPKPATYQDRRKPPLKRGLSVARERGSSTGEPSATTSKAAPAETDGGRSDTGGLNTIRKRTAPAKPGTRRRGTGGPSTTSSRDTPAEDERRRSNTDEHTPSGRGTPGTPPSRLPFSNPEPPRSKARSSTTTPVAEPTVDDIPEVYDVDDGGTGKLPSPRDTRATEGGKGAEQAVDSIDRGPPSSNQTTQGDSEVLLRRHLAVFPGEESENVDGGAGPAPGPTSTAKSQPRTVDGPINICTILNNHCVKIIEKSWVEEYKKNDIKKKSNLERTYILKDVKIGEEIECLFGQ